VVVLPVYEYKCSSGHIFEDFRKMEDRDEILRCKCGKLGKRILSQTHVNGALGVYWPSKGIAQERVIHNLGHKPVHVKSSDHLKRILKATHQREAG
jgi:putative FmdB family regulatory protein